MEEQGYKPSPIGELATQALSFVIGIYFFSVSFAIPYYNWQYAKENGFMKWIMLGEVVATGKALVWPYFAFFSEKEEVAKEQIPLNVEKFWEGAFSFQKAIVITQDTEIPKDKLREKSEEMKSLMIQSANTLASVNTSELNSIYSGWGDVAKDRLIPGVNLMKEFIESGNQAKFTIASSHLEEWDQWMEDNRSKLLKLLRTKYGFETKKYSLK